MIQNNKYRTLLNSRLKLIIVSVYIGVAIVQAQIPTGYYDAAFRKKNAELKTTLHLIIYPHTQLEYYGLATSFRTSDWHPGGYYWDMYSNTKRTSWSGLNREHNMPKSWFGVSSEEVNTWPIGTDLHNLYPSDATANSAKSNYALGVVGSSPIFSNGVVKVGKNIYPGYSGTVFEPADEYKGDFARDYMYMVTSYEDYSTKWQSTGTTSMLNNNTYPVFKPYAVNLLLEWGNNDPVSEKEINRNNAVYQLQGNRNPFIDFPVLSEYIWGKYMDEVWNGSDINPDIDKRLIVSYLQSEKKLFVKLYASSSTLFYIYSVDGIMLLAGNEIDAESKIDVSPLKKGMYILKIYTADTRRTAKFIVT